MFLAQSLKQYEIGYRIGGSSDGRVINEEREEEMRTNSLSERKLNQ